MGQVAATAGLEAGIVINSIERESARRLRLYYVIEGLASFAASLLMVGIFFFTAAQFGWGLKENFLLAAVQGAVYVVGALAAGRFAGRFGRRNLLVGLYVGMAAVASIALLGSAQALVVAVLVAYTILNAAAWPALESLVSTGAPPHELSRRLGLYNLIWSITGAAAVAVNGTLIKYFPAGVFLLPVLIHAVCAVLIRMTNGEAEAGPDAHGHEAPEAGLVDQRRLALILSRIALPASYAVIYSVSALMPLLPTVKELDPTARTLVGSAWMMSRSVAFVLLGATVFWHTRPKLLLWASAWMLLTFIGMTLRPGDFVPLPRAIDVLALVLFQTLLGVMLGMIYCGSLYFGMVLSEGSTEHGGYHEALIGLGSVLGPGVGAATLAVSNGNIRWGIVGVVGIVAASIVAAGVSALRAKRSD